VLVLESHDVDFTQHLRDSGQPEKIILSLDVVVLYMVAKVNLVYLQLIKLISIIYLPGTYNETITFSYPDNSQLSAICCTLVLCETQQHLRP
jgi:hypothetical protein